MDRFYNCQEPAEVCQNIVYKYIFENQYERILNQNLSVFRNSFLFRIYIVCVVINFILSSVRQFYSDKITTYPMCIYECYCAFKADLWLSQLM